jgi:hypothetical protein
MSTAATPRRGLFARIFSFDDGALIRAAFFALLTAAVAMVYLDYRELMASQAETAIADPLAPLFPLLPGFSPGESLGAHPEITTDRAVLESPLTATLGAGGVLELTGTIDPGAAKRVVDEITAHGEYVKTIALNSPGGSVEDALEIGHLIRGHGYATTVPAGALCASSCPLVLAAGVERTADAKAAIGVHQVYASVLGGDIPTGAQAAGFGMAAAQKMTATVSRYLAEMGVDPALWLHALDTPPGSLYFLSPEEQRDFRLVTRPVLARA